MPKQDKKIWQKRLLGTVLALGLSSTFATASPAILASTNANAKFQTSGTDFKSLIVDGQGQVSYIITIEDEATAPYLGNDAPNDDFPDWHKPEMRHFASAFSKQYGITVYGMTSWISSSMVAFLNEDQLQQIINDPRVKNVTPNARVEPLKPPSEILNKKLATPPINPLIQTEILSLNNLVDGILKTAAIGWNIRYMGGPAANVTASPTKIYIIDSGVGAHENLPPIERVNPRKPKKEGATLSTVGCYSHSAHVAGIISGTGYQGRFGVYPGAPLVSVSIHNTPYYAECLFGSESADPEATGAEQFTEPFDFIVQDVIKHKKMGVVTMSINMNAEDKKDLIYAGIKKLITPDDGTNYKGVVFVQSAGNRGNTNDRDDACLHAYNTQDANDGALIVGALDSNGQPVVPLNGVSGFRNMYINAFTAAHDEQGSRYGWCVDIWAPGSEIYSAWGSVAIANGTAYEQSGNLSTPSSNYAYLSGTSMAAPHIAALAAHTIDYYGLTTPAQVEQKIRSFRYPIGSGNYNRNNYDIFETIFTARLFGSAPPAPKPTVEFAFKSTHSSSIISGLRADYDDIKDEYSVVNGSIRVASTTPIKLSFDSIGAKNCKVTKYFNNLSQGLVSYVITQSLVSGTLPSGLHQWDALCTGVNGEVSTASASVTVQVPAITPQISWKIDGVIASGTVTKTSSNNFLLGFSSTNADQCDLKGEQSSDGSSYTQLYNTPNVGINFNWGGALLRFDAGWYRWTATCRSSGGTTSQSLTMQVTPPVITPPAATTCSNAVPLYTSRYNMNGLHDSYMAASSWEHQAALNAGYVNAGTTGRVEQTQLNSNLKQFRRFYNGSLHGHYLSHNSSDIAYVLSTGWVDDGSAGYIYTSQVPGTVPLYIVWQNWNGALDSEHRYTTSTSERDTWVRQGFGDFGVMGYVCP